MIITILLSLMMMAGLFLLLWGGVGFIQDKKFMSSAPKEALVVVPDKMPERFKGQYAVGYIMVVIAFALMGGAMVLGAWNGISNGFTFWQFFIRFMIMLLALKAFDVIFFDWDHDRVLDHVGLVESCDGKTVTTIEGNSGDACKRNSYIVGSGSIAGYGLSVSMTSVTFEKSSTWAKKTTPMNDQHCPLFCGVRPLGLS